MIAAVTFEACMSIPAGGVTVLLRPEQNRVDVQIQWHPQATAVAMVLPRCLELVATKSGLSVRHGGRIYHPRRIAPADGEEWGTP